MRSNNKTYTSSFAIICTLFVSASGLFGQIAKPLIASAVDNTKLVTLIGNTRPEANPQNDRGRLADDFVMPHLQLVLQRSPERAQAAAEFVNELNDPNSPNYHKWLTTEQIAARFGASDQDIATLKSWLAAKGFTVEKVLATKLQIEFSGTAGTVRSAFHTEIHKLEVNGESHYANMSDPEVPAALASAVGGVLFLNNFEPRPLARKRMDSAEFSTGTGRDLVTPADLAVIYNLAPLFAAGYTGVNQTIYVAEDGDIYSMDDWSVFRKVMGLARAYPQATLTQTHPAGAHLRGSWGEWRGSGGCAGC